MRAWRALVPSVAQRRLTAVVDTAEGDNVSPVCARAVSQIRPDSTPGFARRPTDVCRCVRRRDSCRIHPDNVAETRCEGEQNDPAS